ncbi:hypothetical protein NLG97_g10686 [Lecanicillium saksenae]|uniref:Uncharacterized protein n=1 Tax=Lecanicillium saksenae TaxID=468837 RepID=A0ACC1QEB1_9HYPO|nr:hypothetical protein NLG97_g10686 [Lecanicillium saksenae]
MVYALLVDDAPISRSEFTHHKTSKRDMYNETRSRAGIAMGDHKEVLMVNAEDGGIMEGSITTPYFWRGNRWITPPVSAEFSSSLGSGGNNGTSRRYALERNLAVEEPIKAKDLIDGEECWISNGVSGFIAAQVQLRKCPSSLFVTFLFKTRNSAFEKFIALGRLLVVSMSGAQAEAAVKAGQDEYVAKRYKHALEQFTRAMRLCKCNRGMKRDRCSCKNFEAVAEKDGSIFHEAMYTCSCSVGKTFNKCDNPVHIKALDYRAATFESIKELDRAKRDAEWILELAPRLPDGYLRLGKIARLQKKDEYAWKIYNAGVDAGNANRMATSPKFQQLYSARNKLHVKFCRKDPILLPSELFVWILSCCTLVERVRCLRVSKQWQRTLTSRDFASLWKVLDFTGTSTPRRPPRIDFLRKLVAGAGRDVRKIVIEEKRHRFQLSQAKLFILLNGATRLEHLELSFPDHTLRIDPKAGLCKTLKTLSLRFFVAEPKKNIVGLDYIPVSAYPFALLNPVAEAIETLHLSGLPMSWFREQDVPLMPKIKNLHLQMRPGSTALFPIVSHSLHCGIVGPPSPNFKTTATPRSKNAGAGAAMATRYPAR